MHSRNRGGGTCPPSPAPCLPPSCATGAAPQQTPITSPVTFRPNHSACVVDSDDGRRTQHSTGGGGRPPLMAPVDPDMGSRVAAVQSCPAQLHSHLTAHNQSPQHIRLCLSIPARQPPRRAAVEAPAGRAPHACLAATGAGAATVLARCVHSCGASTRCLPFFWTKNTRPAAITSGATMREPTACARSGRRHGSRSSRGTGR
jgi:hypothetical protein